MPKGSLAKRSAEWTDADLNVFKNKSKYISKYNSIKKFKHGK
jgi:hypothetical protein